MKSNPAVSGGSLTSKPTWSNASRCSATSAFLFSALWDSRNDRSWVLDNLKRKLIMYIGGGLVTVVIVVFLVLFVLRR